MSSDYPRDTDRVSTPSFKTVEGLRALPSQLLIRDPHLKRVMLDAHSVVAEGDQLVAGLKPAQLTWSPSPDVWSLAQIADHLYRAAEEYLVRIPAAIADARARGRLSEPGGYRASWFGKFFINSLAPNYKRKLKAPKIFVPAVTADPTAWTRFRTQQERLFQLIKEADGVDLRKTRVVSPVSRLLRLSLGESFDVIVTHQKRHLSQARRLRESAAFPNG